MIETMRKVLGDASIAAALNREQIRPPGGENWTEKRVSVIASVLGSQLLTPNRRKAPMVTQAETATRLQISPMSVHRLINSGILPARPPRSGVTGGHLCRRSGH